MVSAVFQSPQAPQGGSSIPKVQLKTTKVKGWGGGEGVVHGGGISLGLREGRREQEPPLCGFLCSPLLLTLSEELNRFINYKLKKKNIIIIIIGKKKNTHSQTKRDPAAGMGSGFSSPCTSALDILAWRAHLEPRRREATKERKPESAMRPLPPFPSQLTICLMLEKINSVITIKIRLLSLSVAGIRFLPGPQVS